MSDLNSPIHPFANPPISASVVFEAVIGLEIHAQLLTASKIFCSCSTAFEQGVTAEVLAAGPNA